MEAELSRQNERPIGRRYVRKSHEGGEGRVGQGRVEKKSPKSRNAKKNKTCVFFCFLPPRHRNEQKKRNKTTSSISYSKKRKKRALETKKKKKTRMTDRASTEQRNEKDKNPKKQNKTKRLSRTRHVRRAVFFLTE